MFLERYEYFQGASSNQFYFWSDGPKGRILKVVSYRFLIKADGFHYFNVGFGDLDQKSRKINDLSVSDNKDHEKILATVAATALKFTSHIQKCRLIVKGSTPARIRLYQMKIVAYYDHISELFDIQGETETGFERFSKDKKYLGFRFERFKFEI